MNAMPIPLGNAMHIMCSDIRKHIRDTRPVDHCVLLHHFAEKYELYYNGLAPVWLSRVIEGIMNDVAQGTDDQL